MIYVILILLLVAACIAAFYFYNKVQSFGNQKAEWQQKYEALELKTHDLELQNIKYKLNPHLFKNTLNSIQSHAYQTYYSLDKLANVLDFILYESDRKYVSLKEELDFAMSLIEINRLKTSPLFDLRIKNKIDETNPFYTQELIAPLITVDLIENAFKHADLQNTDAFIAITFELKDNEFSLSVSNKISPKVPMKKSNSGFGKENLKKRLDIIYKNNYVLEQSTEGEIYIAHLKINLLGQKTLIQQNLI